MDYLKLDTELIRRILERGSDVWIKKTKTGVVILEAGFTKRAEIEDKMESQKPPL